MKVSLWQIYLFRVTQVIALLLFLPLTLAAALFVLATFIVSALLFALLGLIGFPFLTILIIFDFIATFSRSRFSDPVFGIIDTFLMMPEVVLSTFRLIASKAFLVPGQFLNYALE